MKSRLGMILTLVAVLLAGPVVMAMLAAGTASADQAQTTRDYFRMMDQKYEQYTGQPGEVTRGTGFKPYERYKWFAEPRLDAETGNQPLGARWAAFEQMKAMEQQYGTRSETWFSDGPINVAGRCLAIAVHPTNPSIVYAGFASSGIWKTTDGGTTWTPLGDNLPTMAVGAIKIDSTDPNRIWIGTGEGWGNVDAIHGTGVLVSTDAGATWTQTAFNYPMAQGRDVYELEYNPATGTLMVAADNGLWRSTDGGASFTEVMPTGEWKDVKLKKGSSSVMFASTHGWADFGFYRSTDDGATWTHLTNGTPASGVLNNRFALTDVDPNVIYWGISNPGDVMSIYKSTDGGDSFIQAFAGSHYGGQGWYDISIAVDPTNKNIVYSGGVNFYRSTNGGSSFTTWAGNVHVDHHAVAWAPSDPTHFWLGSDGGCWRSTNSGASFTSRNAGLTTLQFYAINQSQTMPTRALGGTQDNGTYMYNNNLNWQFVIGGDGFFTEVDRATANTMYGELYYGDHRRSTDGGTNFIPRNSGITEQGPWSTPTWMDYSNPWILWTAHNTRIYRTTNRGDLWTWTNNPVGLGGGRSINQCRAHPEVVVVLGGAKVWLTTDSGATWADRTSGLITASTFSDVAVHPTDPNTIVVTLSTYSSTFHQISKSTDQGMSWVHIDGTLPNEPVNSIEIDPDHPDWYFIGTDNGVWVSFDAGANFQPFNTGLPYVVVSDLRLHDTARILRAGTHGRGMWEVDISNLSPTAVNDNVRPAVQPITLKVFGNPSSDRATLRYGLRQPGQVKLALFDLQGRQVKSLVDRFEYPVMNTLEVDLKGLPSGVYFARLEANGAQTSQKLVVER